MSWLRLCGRPRESTRLGHPQFKGATTFLQNGAMDAEEIEIRRLASVEVHEQLDGLAGVLVDCVAGGASVSYLTPFSHKHARGVFEASPPRSSRAAGCFWLPSPTATWSARCR